MTREQELAALIEAQRDDDIGELLPYRLCDETIDRRAEEYDRLLALYRNEN